MGNSSSEIVSRVEGLDLAAVTKTIYQDLELLDDPSIIFDTGKLLVRTDLEDYKVPGFDQTKLKEEDVNTDQEEAMILSLNNHDRLREKHGDAIKNIIEDILRKRGEDASSKEILMKLQYVIRSFEGLLRTEQFRKLKTKNEENKSNVAQGTLSTTATAAIKMGLNTLLFLIECVGDLKPELYQRIIKQATDILSVIPPLSLQTAEPTISESLAEISQFFDSIISNDSEKMKKIDKLSCLAPYFGLCIASGNLSSFLMLALRFLQIERTDRLRPALESIYKPLAIFKNWGSIAPRWSPLKAGPNTTFSDTNLEVSASAGWTTILGEEEYFSGLYYFEFTFGAYNEAHMVGIVDSKYTNFSAWSDIQFASFSYQANSSIFDRNNEVYKWEAWKEGDKIGIFLNMDDKTATFYKNGIKEPQEKHGKLPDSVRFYTSLGANSKIKSVFPESYPEEIMNLVEKPSLEFKENKLFKLLDGERPNHEFLSVEPSEISVFIINKLAYANYPVLRMLQSKSKNLEMPKKWGISLDLQFFTVDLLDTAFVNFLKLARTHDYSKLSQESCQMTLASTQQLIRAHLLASLNHNDHGLDLSLRNRIMEHTIQLFSVMPNTKASEEATLTLSLCFDVFYNDPKEKLSYLMGRLEDMKKGKEQEGVFRALEDRIFLEMAKSEKLFPALDIKDDDHYREIEHYFELLLDLSSKISQDAIAKDTATASGIIKLLETSQSVLMARTAQNNHQGKWLEIFSSYSSKMFHEIDGILKKILSLHPDGKIPDDLTAKLKNTVVANLFESLLYYLMLMNMNLDLLANVLTSLQNIIATLSVFQPKPKIFVQGTAIQPQVYESSHNYGDNLNTEYLVRVPRASKYILSFDPQFKTENGCDYLELWLDQNRGNKFARWEGENFPKQPVEVISPLLFFTFHSDGSVNYWGWKIDIKAYVEANFEAKQWPDTVKDSATMLLGFISTNLISGTFDSTPDDEKITELLENPLLKYGISDSALSIVKEPTPISESLFAILTNASLTRRAKRALTASGYPDAIKKRIIRSNSATISIGDYAAKYSKNVERVKFSNIPFLQELIEGNEKINAAWASLKKKSGVIGPATNIGGAEMDQAERAIFAVYIAFYEVTDTVNKIFDSPGDLGATMKYIIKQSNLIRGWAQKHKQKLMDYGKPDTTYTDICKDIVIKCVFLLSAEYKISLNELGANKVMKNLFSSVAKIQSQSTISKAGSKWKTVKKAVESSSKLKGLLSIQSKTKEPENEDVKEFLRVAELVTKFLESSIPVEDITTVIAKRRIKGIARTLGFLSFANLIGETNKKETSLVKAFSDSLKVKGEKLHYWQGLEGTDPILLHCVQNSFFQVYTALQKELSYQQNERLKPADYNHYLTVIDAMSCPLKGIDGHIILEQQFPSTISHLLKWAKGYIGEDEIHRPFKKELCITRLGILPQADLPENAIKILLEERPDEQSIFLVIDKAGSAKPIIDAKLSNQPIEGYEDATGVFTFKGERRTIYIKRDDEKVNLKYLTEISENLEFVFTDYDNLIEPEPEEENKKRLELRMRLSKSSWSLFKELLYSIVGSWVEPNESLKSLIQELFMKVIFSELKFNDTLKTLDSEPIILAQLAKGESWIGKSVIPKEIKKNPVQEWLRQFRNETGNFENSIIREIINEFVQKADPAMKGVITVDDLQNLKRETVETLEKYEENKNAKGEYDFFRYLNVLKGLADQFPGEIREYFRQSKLWQYLPNDFYQAAEEYDLENVGKVIQNFIIRLKPAQGESFMKYIELFANSKQPGIVENVQFECPAEFKDESGCLDFYVTLNAIISNKEKFANYFHEIEDGISMYNEIPASCIKVTSIIAGQIDYISSLLWCIYGSLGSHCLPRLLAREDYFVSLLQLTFCVPSAKVISCGARILRYIIPTQHSPQTLQPYWEIVSKILNSKLDIISFLLTKIGNGMTWYENQDSKEISLRWAYEAESFILAFVSVDRWRAEVINVLTRSLEAASQMVIRGVPLTQVHSGTLFFMASSSKHSDGYGFVPIVLSHARLNNCRLPRGVIREFIDADKAKFYSVVEDANATEPLDKIDGIEPQLNIKLYDKLSSDEKERLSTATIAFWENLRGSGNVLIKANSEAIANLRSLYVKLNIASMACMLDVLESKETKHPEMEGIINKFINRGNPLSGTSKKIYQKVMSTLAMKLQAVPKPQEKKQITEEEAMTRFTEYSEAEQALVQELMWMNVPAVKILQCFEAGINDKEAIINYQEQAPENAVLLYKLEALEDSSFKMKDSSGNSELYQNGLYHFVINNPKGTSERREIRNTLPNTIFHSIPTLCTTITIIAAIEGKLFNNKLSCGLKIGDLEVGITTAVGRPHFAINGEPNGEVNVSEPLIIRIFAKANGEVTIINDKSGIRSEKIYGNVYNGYRVGEFGMYLDFGGSASLLCFEVYDGKYTGGIKSKVEKAKELEGGERFVKIKTKDQNLDKLRLKLLGLSEEEAEEALANSQDLSSALEYSLNAFGLDIMRNPPLSLDQEIITDIKIFDDVASVPSDYKIAQIYENAIATNFSLPDRKILAMKKEKFLTGKCCIGLSIAENPGDFTDIGDLSISDERRNQFFVKTGTADKKNTPLKDIAFIKVTSTYSAVLPFGYALVSDKEGNAINIASKNEKKYYILVGMKSTDTLMNCPIYPLKNISNNATSFGLVDQLPTQDSGALKKEEEKSYEEYTVMELYNLLLDIEEMRCLALSKKLLVTTLKKYPSMLMNMPGSASLAKLLSYVDSELENLETPVRTLLKSLDREDFRLKAARECLTILISCLIGKSAGPSLKTITVESLHPYNDGMDVDDTITIPGARGLKFVFDPQCYTENGCDTLRFYEKPGRQGEIKCLSGQGESSWQSFEIPGDTVYTYFHSDGSVHYWGYKFDVIPVGSGSQTPKDELKPDAALWMLEKFVENVNTNEELKMLYTPRFLQPLFLFILSTPAVEEKSRALSILKSFIKYPNPTLETIIKLLFSEANELYVANKQAKSSHPLLQASVSLLFKAIEVFYTGSQETWFIELNELVSDMKGLTDKDENLEMFLFDTFKSKIPAIEHVKESSHPYRRQTKSEFIQIPGAAFLNIELDPQSKVESRDSIFFSFDQRAKEPAEKLVSASVETCTSAGWTDTPKGPDIVLSNNNKTVTRTNSSGWGSAIFNEIYSSGKVRVNLHIDQDGDSAYLYFGVISASDTNYNLTEYIGSDCSREVWSWKKSGEFHKKGSNNSGVGYATNDMVSMLIDVDAQELTFYKNDEEVYKFTGIANVVVPAICFGGSSQLVSIISVERVGSGGQATSIDKKKLRVQGDHVYSWFPVNVGYSKDHTWKDYKETATRSEDKRVITQIGEEPAIYDTTPEFNAGKHYIETTICSDGRIGLGFAFKSTVDNRIIEHESSVIIYSNIEGFKIGDVVGAFADFDDGKFKFYKNGKFLVTKRSPFPITEQLENLKFVTVLTASQQRVMVSETPKLPNDVDNFNINVNTESSCWGYKFKVSPEFRGRSKKLIESFLGFANDDVKNEWNDVYCPKYKRLFKTGAAEQLIIYLDEMTQSKGKDVMALTNEEIDPTEGELIYYPELEKVSKDDMRGLYQILLNFNKRVQESLYLFNLHIESYQSMTELQRVFAGSRCYVFFKIKNGLLKDCLTKTNSDVRGDITIDRPKAARHRDRGDIDSAGQFSIFGQIYRALITRANREYRNPERIYTVKYRGEASIDAGGPYNETMSNMCNELQSTYLRLLVPCPNNVHNIGENRESWIINPAADNPQDLELFTFLGKLMGCAIRTQNNLNLSLPPLFWKRLFMDPLTIRDLRGSDVCIVQILEILRNPSENQLTPDNFAYAYDEKFTTKDSGGREVELIPDGKEKQVTYHNAGEYADLIEKYRLNENPKAYEAIRNGLCAVVPIDYLNLFSWKQIEILVCGAANIDIEILKANTDYEGCTATDPHILLFWESLTEMIPKERTLFLKFVWGRSKLPSGRDWKHMKITRYNPPGQVNNYLPISHTCFFTIDLPPYTNKETMKSKLLYAVTHCTDIDLDGTASGGWEEED